MPMPCKRHRDSEDATVMLRLLEAPGRAVSFAVPRAVPLQESLCVFAERFDFHGARCLWDGQPINLCEAPDKLCMPDAVDLVVAPSYVTIEFEGQPGETMAPWSTTLERHVALRGAMDRFADVAELPTGSIRYTHNHLAVDGGRTPDECLMADRVVLRARVVWPRVTLRAHGGSTDFWIINPDMPMAKLLAMHCESYSAAAGSLRLLCSGATVALDKSHAQLSRDHDMGELTVAAATVAVTIEAPDRMAYTIYVQPTVPLRAALALYCREQQLHRPSVRFSAGASMVGDDDTPDSCGMLGSATLAASAIFAAATAAAASAEQESRCCVCCDAPKEAFLQPCGHVAMCLACAGKVQDCPVCRKAIESVLKAFVA
jgi:hypothetical protein